MNSLFVLANAASAERAPSCIRKIEDAGLDQDVFLPIKKRKITKDDATPSLKKAPVHEHGGNGDDTDTGCKGLKPAPFFYYTDHSEEPDEDPLTPLTPMARVPNFPAKMHAILARPDLADVIAWQPHGRGWKILKPRQFEVRVLPTYFQHSKFSSFVRQANGWGFRRITRGEDRNTYYHELFLRGLPHLCKKMRRPGVSEKTTLSPEYEPTLNEINKFHPVPEKAVEEDDSILLQFTVNDGPKARMPVHGGLVPTKAAFVRQDMRTEQKATPMEQMPSMPQPAPAHSVAGENAENNLPAAPSSVLNAAAALSCTPSKDQEMTGFYLELYRQRCLMHEHELNTRVRQAELAQMYRHLPARKTETAPRNAFVGLRGDYGLPHCFR